MAARELWVAKSRHVPNPLPGFWVGNVGGPFPSVTSRLICSRTSVSHIGHIMTVAFIVHCGVSCGTTQRRSVRPPQRQHLAITSRNISLTPIGFHRQAIREASRQCRGSLSGTEARITRGANHRTTTADRSWYIPPLLGRSPWLVVSDCTIRTCGRWRRGLSELVVPFQSA